MARPTLLQVRTLGDIMVSNLWDVAISAPTIIKDHSSAFTGDVNFRAISAEIPKRTGTSLDITIRGHKIKQPGDYDYSGTITLTLLESDTNSPVHNFIRNWREQIIGTNTGYQGKKADIEAIVTLTRLNRQNGISNVPGTTWTLYGVYLEDYELGDLNETGDIIQPALTLSYDYFTDGDIQTNPTSPTVVV